MSETTLWQSCIIMNNCGTHSPAHTDAESRQIIIIILIYQHTETHTTELSMDVIK